MFTEQRIRAFLFYLSVFIFLIGLPVILSSAFSYKFDRRTLKFTKTGLISLKTQPAGASIFLNGKLLQEKTPATIRDVLPGDYNIKLELADHYSWAGEVGVKRNIVTLLDKIILFPLRPDVKQVNKEQFDFYWVDEEKGMIYYADYEEHSVYSTDLEGTYSEKVADFVRLNPPAVKWKLSPDRKKILYFNRRQIGIAYLDSDQEPAAQRQAFIIEHTQGPIEDVFWHSDNYHLAVVSNRNLEVIEAEFNSQPVVLVKLNKPGAHAFFNDRADTLYFIDSQKAGDGKVYENLYKLELNAKMFPFLDLIKPKTDE
ncbi:MAG: PEGA domain-containing protein [Candidatus Omnitrophota bacterium]